MNISDKLALRETFRPTRKRVATWGPDHPSKSFHIQPRSTMKAYGHSRRDKLECPYGCCTGKSGRKRNCRGVVDRTNRKTARQAAVDLLRKEGTMDTSDNEG